MGKYVTSKFTNTSYYENGKLMNTFEGQRVVRKSSEDPYYSVFFKEVDWIFNIKSTITLKVLHYLLQIIEFNTGVIKITTGERKSIMRTIGINKSSLSRSIKELISLGVLRCTENTDMDTGEVTVSKGDYYINPIMFWKGESSRRKKLINRLRERPNDESLLNSTSFESDTISST